MEIYLLSFGHLVQLVRTHPSHGWGREFESPSDHHWKIKPHVVRLLFFQWWNEVARLHFTARSATSLKNEVFSSHLHLYPEVLLVKSFHYAYAPFHLWRRSFHSLEKFSPCGSKVCVILTARRCRLYRMKPSGFASWHAVPLHAPQVRFIRWSRAS